MTEDQKPPPPGWKISEPYAESKQSAYVARMVKEISALPRERRKVPDSFNGKAIKDLTYDEQQEFYFSMQAKSTQDAIVRQRTRKPEDDTAWVNRPIDPAAQVRNEDGSVNIAERSLSARDVVLFESARHTPKNTIGQSGLGSVDAEKRERGIHAFTYSKPADPTTDDLKRLKKLVEMDAVMVTEVSPEAIKKVRLWWKFWKRKESDREEWSLFDSSTWRSGDPD